MLVFPDEGDPEDSDVATTVRRALLAKLLAPTELVLEDGGLPDFFSSPQLLCLPDAQHWVCRVPTEGQKTHGCRSQLTLAPGRRARTCSPVAGSLLCISVHGVPSHIVSCENPRCVSDRPRQHR